MPTLNLGLGVSPLGSGPYGVGTPATAPTPGGAVNRGPFGLQYGSPLISEDPATRGQYVYDEFGRRVGQPDGEHMVTLAMRTKRGSCCVQSLGQRFDEVRKITDSFENEQKAYTQEAFAGLVSRKVVEIVSVKADGRNGMPSKTKIALRDLTNKNPIDRTI